MDSIPPSETESRPLSFAFALLYTLLFVAGLLLAVGVADALHPGAITDIVTQTACEVLSLSAVFFMILRVHEPTSSIRQVLALRRASVVAIVLAIVVGALLALPANHIGAILDARDPLPNDQLELLARLHATPTMPKKIGLLVTTVVIGPIFEGLFFHGALFSPLARRKELAVVAVVTSALETLANLDPRRVLILFLASLSFGWIRAVTGSVVPSLAARISFYAVIMAPLVFGRDLPPLGHAVVAVATLLGAAGVTAMSALSRHDPHAVAARASDAD